MITFPPSEAKRFSLLLSEIASGGESTASVDSFAKEYRDSGTCLLRIASSPRKYSECQPTVRCSARSGEADGGILEKT